MFIVQHKSLFFLFLREHNVRKDAHNLELLNSQRSLLFHCIDVILGGKAGCHTYLCHKYLLIIFEGSLLKCEYIRIIFSPDVSIMSAPKI